MTDAQPASLGDDTSELSSLGSKTTKYAFQQVDASLLESFPNQFHEGEKQGYVTQFSTDEFTSLCPKTSQPDFGSISILYCADEKCLETKSLKLYLFSFRNTGSFMETIVNTICRDIAETVDPHWIEVCGTFKVRGGVEVKPTARWSKHN